MWCLRPTDIVMWAEGVGRQMPLHPTCAIDLVYKYHRWLNGTLRDRDFERATRVWGAPRQIVPGVVKP